MLMMVDAWWVGGVEEYVGHLRGKNIDMDGGLGYAVQVVPAG
jgi:hypothetical protein